MDTFIGKTPRRTFKRLVAVGEANNQYRIITPQHLLKCVNAAEAVKEEIAVTMVRFRLQIRTHHCIGMPKGFTPEIAQYPIFIILKYLGSNIFKKELQCFSPFLYKNRNVTGIYNNLIERTRPILLSKPNDLEVGW